MKTQRGFTLVEIAIVLVVIGLLLGGVLKGQEIIKNAKISSMQNSVKEITAAIGAYQDRYRALPGDDAQADRHVGVSQTQVGNGNGRLKGQWGSTNDQDETRLFWLHLRKAGILSGDGTQQPTHPFGGIMGVQNNPYRIGGVALCFGNLSGEIAQLLDDKMDDGKANSGSVRGSSSQSNYRKNKVYTVCAAV